MGYAGVKRRIGKKGWGVAGGGKVEREWRYVTFRGGEEVRMRRDEDHHCHTV